MGRRLYSLLWYLGTPLVAAYLLWRARRQPEYLRHWPERWGVVPRRRRRGRPLIWVHAVSVGETRAAEPLIRALQLRYPQADWLLTCMTPTGRETARALFGDKVRQAYLPYDYPSAMRRFLSSWGPALGIVMETELWPNLTAQARALNVPLAAVNVRLSERSLRRGKRWGGLIRDALARLDTVIAQTQDDASRLAELGRLAVPVTGNLKFDVTPKADAVALGRRWRESTAGRPVVLAASTRDGEEELLLQAWQARQSPLDPQTAMPGQSPMDPQTANPGQSPPVQSSRQGVVHAPAGSRPLLVIVPRHPQRFDDVAQMCRQRGLRVLRRSEFAVEDVGNGRGHAHGSEDGAAGGLADVDVLLGDSMGEMFAYYALADVAIIGGSLLPFGAQNLIEACALGVPVLFGPHTFNFREAADQAVQAGAAVRVADAGEALREAQALLADDARRQSMSARALAFAQKHGGATERTLQALGPLLARCRVRLEVEPTSPDPKVADQVSGRLR